MSRLSVLVVDDDAAMRTSLRDLLGAAGWHVDTVARGADAIAALASAPPDVVLSDLRMPEMDGLALTRAIAGPEAPPVLLLSAHGDIAAAVEAVKAGAWGFLEKPCAPDHLLDELARAAEAGRASARVAGVRERLAALSGLDRILSGGGAAVAALRAAVADAALSASPVLIEGAPGTGRADVARVVHDLAPEAAGAFVVIPALQAAETALPSEGTLYLDGLDQCSPDLQHRLGAVLPAGARIMAGVGEGGADALVPDLRWRLATLTLRLPPLGERRDDIADLFMAEVAALAPRYDLPLPGLTPEDVALLLAHPWPGNLREMQAVAERYVLRARRGAASVAGCLLTEGAVSVPSTLREAVAAFEREVIGQALVHHGGRMEDVAEALGIGRRTLNEKIVKLGLDKDRLLRR